MDFRLDDGQLALRDTIARFCAAHFGIETLVERAARAVDRRLWRSMGDLGVFNLMVAHDDGGSGLGAVEAAIVFEQLGSHLVCGPTLWSTLGASIVQGAASGDRIVGGVVVAPHGSEPLLVEHASDLDVLMLVSSEGIVVCDRDELPRYAMESPLDPLTPVGRFESVPQGRRVGDADTAERMRALGVVLAAATLLGISSAALDVARNYALQREQFGVPIGSFQAIKHILADMFVRTALARSASYAAAAAYDDPAIGDQARAAAGAKLLAGEAAIDNARAAVQVLGGMGFTWDMPPHYLLKRAWVLEQTFGTSDTHALALGSSLEVGIR